MNIVKISGETAQQMFQYAFYLQLLQHDPEALLHTPSEKWINAKFRLPRFLEAAPEQLAQFGKGGWKSRLMSVLKKPAGPTVGDPADHRFDRTLFDAHNTYFDGQWLSPRYFEGVEEEIRKAFQVPAKTLTEKSQSMVNMLSQGKTVVMHVHNPQGKDCTCTPDYYNWAIANILSAEHKVRFYVFTTDLEWVKANVNFQGAPNELVAYPAEGETGLLAYLYHAEHIIMANTLVSWWSAWLNDNPDKIVIAPKVWSKTQPTPDLIPLHWTSIPTT